MANPLIAGVTEKRLRGSYLELHPQSTVVSKTAAAVLLGPPSSISPSAAHTIGVHCLAAEKATKGKLGKKRRVMEDGKVFVNRPLFEGDGEAYGPTCPPPPALVYAALVQELRAGKSLVQPFRPSSCCRLRPMAAAEVRGCPAGSETRAKPRSRTRV